MDFTFAVVLETAYSAKILFEGTKQECKQFIYNNPEMCDSYTFIQELEAV